MIVKTTNQPEKSQEIDAMICWMGEKQMRLNAKYGIQHTTRLGRGIIKEIIYVVDLNELNRIGGQTSIQKMICRIKIKTTTPVFLDSYRKNRNTGSFIIIDETNNNTVGAGMIIRKELLHSPTIFHWKGYFDSIQKVDVFVIYDDMQYTKRDWRNRNLIKTVNGLKWLSIPVQVKGKYFQKINETLVSDPDWSEKHFNLIKESYRKAPYFKSHICWIESLYSNCKSG